ncbi:unnamed protein product [Staurois parvus]|uniref:Uncharacterized protein n=1 Tax=Staurois parvus TaxID=386267 RepID=A0ABN9F8Y0_9NEOB|nr:unnamed protein product [Staurois parvus]
MWNCWALVCGIDGATLIIGALIISALMISLSAEGEDCR